MGSGISSRWRAGGAAPLAGVILRGLGQVMFRPEPLAGALFLLALAISAPVLALAALAGAVVSTGVARTLGADVQMGLHGFNGALAGIAMALFPGVGPWLLVALVLVAPAVAALVYLHLAPVLAARGLPVLTAPFNLVALPMLALAGVAGPSGPPAPEATGWALVVLSGTVNGFAQVFFLQGMLPGLLIAAGLALVSLRALGLAVVASAASAVLALVIGPDPGTVAAGLVGYNGILVALALGTLVLAPGLGATLVAMAAALVAVPVHLGLAALLAPFGLPALTVAFVLVTWAAALFARRLRV